MDEPEKAFVIAAIRIKAEKDKKAAKEAGKASKPQKVRSRKRK